MSTFNRKIGQLQTELDLCLKYCKDIRTKRNLGSNHYHFDQFQSALESGKEAIPIQYDTVRNALGPKVDIGDDKARAEMADHILDIQEDIKARVYDISQPGGPRRTGFSKLLDRWSQIYKAICKTIYNLSRRIEAALASKTPTAPPVQPVPTTQPQPQPKPPVTSIPSNPNVDDSVAITMKELDFFLEHVKNSWEEENIDGMIRYINVFDPRRRTWDRPLNAYIKPAAPRTTRPPRKNSGGW